MIFNTLNLSEINYLAVFVASLAYFFLGAIWYSKLMFARSWMAALNIDPENIDKSNVGRMLLTTFIADFILSLSIAILIHLISIQVVSAAVKLGLLIGIGFIFTTFLTNTLFEKKSSKLLMINSGYHILGCIIASSILVLWQ